MFIKKLIEEKKDQSHRYNVKDDNTEEYEELSKTQYFAKMSVYKNILDSYVDHF